MNSKIVNNLLSCEQKACSLVDSLPDNIARWDLEGRYLYVNAVHERTLNLSAEEIIGKSIHDAFPDSHKQVRAAIAQVIATGESVSVLEHVQGNGEIRIHHVSLVPEQDIAGNIISIMGIGRDMTDLYRYQDEISAKKRELDALAESSPGMMGAFHLRPDGSICMPYVSANIKKLFGVTPEEVRHDASPLLALNHPDDALRVGETIAKSAQSMTTWHEEYRVMHPVLGERWMESNCDPQPHPDGGIVWYGYVHDITERKLAEEMRLQREREFRSLAANLPDNIARYNRDGVAVYLNPMLERTLGEATAAAKIGKTPREYYPDGSHEDYAQLLDSVLASGAAGEFEETFVESDGQPHVHQIRMVAEHDENGEIMGVLAIGRDITENKRLEKAICEQKDFQQILLNALKEVGIQMLIIENGRIEYALNRKYFHDAGYTDEEIDSGIMLNDLIHPDSRAEAMDRHLRRLSGEPVSGCFEIGLISRFGERREFETSVAVVQDSNPLRVITIGKDITERKRAEHERQLNAHFLECMDRVNRAIQGASNLEQMMSDVLDIVLAIFNCDRAFLVYPGDPESSEFSVPMERTTPEYPGALSLNMTIPMGEEQKALFRTVRDAGRVVTLGPGAQYPLPSYLSRQFSVKSQMLMTLQPKLDNLWQFGIHQCSQARTWTDAEERLLQEIGRRLEDGLSTLLVYRDLQAREREFRSLAANLPDNIVRYNLQGITVYVNPVLEKTLGECATKLIGTTPREFHLGGSYEDYAQLLDRVLASGEAGELEKTIPGANGDSTVHQIRMVPERGENGEMIGVLAIGRDITEIKRAEMERQVNAHFLECMDRINRAIQGAENLNQMMGNVLDIVLEILDCDRVFLVYPCDPEIAEFQVPMERTRPEYPGALTLGESVPMCREMSGLFRTILSASGPVKFGAAGKYPLPRYLAEHYEVKSSVVMALHPKLDQPWQFGIHYCSRPHSWSYAEERLFQEISRRLEDGLSTLLVYRDLQAREREFRSLAENLPDNIVRYNRQGVTIYANPALEKTLGDFADKIIGTAPRDYHPDDAGYIEYVKLLDGVLANEKEGEIERLVVDSKGNLNIHQIRMVPEFGAHGELIGALGIGHDITDHKRMDEALRAREEELQMLVEYSPVAMLVEAGESAGRKIVMINQKFIELFGYTHEELRDMDHWWQQVCQNEQSQKELAAEWRRRVDQANQNQASIEPMEVSVTSKDGSGHYVRISLASIGGKNILTFEDLTQRNRAVAALIDLTENLEKIVIKRTTDLEESRLEAERANRAKSAFLANMSHEIRTPMNGVIGMIDVLCQTNLSEQQIEMTNIIHDSAFSLLSIIDDILDFSKIEAGKFNIDRIPMNVNKVVEGVCEALARVAENKSVELTLFTDPSLPVEILGDPARLRQILLNLVGNAIKFSCVPDRQGRVSVRTALIEKTAERVTLEFQVIDNGIGIDQDTQTRLFTPFTQADSSTTRHFGGTGLGLAISRQLVNLMGGEIVIQSELDKGSQFRVRIHFSAQAETHETALPPEMQLVAGLSCLVVGNIESLACDLTAYLEHGGAKVERLTDIDAAQKWINRERQAGYLSDICVVVIDTPENKPKLDELRAIIRAHPRLEGRFVVIGRGKRRRVRIEKTDLVSIDANGMHRLRFLEAVSIAAGRTRAYRIENQPVDIDIRSKPLTREEAQLQGRLILVAEDNEINQKVILQQLALLGQVADMAANGHEALKYWKNGQYGILLTDLHMPGQDGYELATAIRTAEAGKTHIPIIAFTANALKAEEAHCLAIGMDDYLSKPVQLLNLKAMLEKWLPVAPAPDILNQNIPTVSEIPMAVNINVFKTLTGINDETMIQSFLHDFRLSAEKIAMELRTRHAAGELAAIGALAHKLKSSSRTMGALALGDLCEEMERAGKNENSSGLVELMEKFEQELAMVMVFLNQD
jgi:PAS domain S-box-containing protein